MSNGEMMTSDDIIKLVAGLGIGSGASALITAVVAAKSGKGKSRADAADILIGAAERVGKMNESLDSEVHELKAAIDEIQVAFIQYLADEISREELLKMVKELRK